MSALFGFSGLPDGELQSGMHSSLRHRGLTAAKVIASANGTIGYFSGDSDLASNHLHLAEDASTGCSVVVSGWVRFGEREIDATEFLFEFLRGREKFLESLTGDFVAAILTGESAYLIRDGAGQRSLYYSFQDGRLLFGSEPKAIWSVSKASMRLRRESLVEYLAFSFVPQQNTMLAGLFELLPGHVATVDLETGNIKLDRFFRFEDERLKKLESEFDSAIDWPAEFRMEFGNAVQRRMHSEGHAVFLSGGLDSSVVAAEVVRQASRPVDTFALHFGTNYPNELEFARAVAERIGSRHHEVLIRPQEFVKRLRDMVWYLDEPIGDPITMPNFELSSIVARDYQFAFNGEGGDPCFGGPKNIPMLLQHWYGGIQRDDDFRELAYLASYRRGYEEIHRLLNPDFLKGLDVKGHLTGILKPFFEQRSACFLDKLCSINIRLKGGHLILPKVERMWGASRLTPLSPLFDSEVVKFSYRMPSTMRLKSGIEKRVLKLAFADSLPSQIIDRPKSGMRVPVHYWFQGELRRFAKSILNRRKLKRDGIWNPDRVQQLLAYNTEEGPGRYGIRLWMLITFELWREMVTERRHLEIATPA